jgi:hypothetical protein
MARRARRTIGPLCKIEFQARDPSRRNAERANQLCSSEIGVSIYQPFKVLPAHSSYPLSRDQASDAQNPSRYLERKTCKPALNRSWHACFQIRVIICALPFSSCAGQVPAATGRFRTDGGFAHFGRAPEELSQAQLNE